MELITSRGRANTINNFDSEKFGNDHYHAMGLKLQPTMAMIFSNESLTGMFTFFFLEHEKKFHFWASKGRKMGSQFSYTMRRKGRPYR